MNLFRAMKAAPQRGPKEYFTGTVWLREFATASPVRVVEVTFEPGARTAWHTHPHGQLLRILAGIGRAQKAGEKVAEVLPGDVIWFEAGERHWHGAAPHCPMSHLAVQLADANGRTAGWQEQVSEDDYLGG